jgi:hypothetical protein
MTARCASAARPADKKNDAVQKNGGFLSRRVFARHA